MPSIVYKCCHNHIGYWVVDGKLWGGLLQTVLLLFACASLVQAAEPTMTSILLLPNGTWHEQLAAHELRRYLYLRTGTLLPFVATPDEATGSLIAAGTYARPEVLACTTDAALKARIQSLKAQEYLLRTVSFNDRRVLLIVGGDPLGVLYGVYDFVRGTGVGFSLTGDAVPDERDPRLTTDIPNLDRMEHPLFDRRGTYFWGDIVHGWMNKEDNKAFVTQLVKLRGNFIMRRYGDLSWAMWGMRECGRLRGMGDLYEHEDATEPGEKDLFAWKQFARNSPEWKQREFTEGREWINLARQYGIGLCYEVQGGIADKLDEAMQRQLPIDFLATSTEENLLWQGGSAERWIEWCRGMQQALKDRKAPYKFALTGWVLGDYDDPLRVVPGLEPSVPISHMTEWLGNNGVSPGFYYIHDREKWAIPWVDTDMGDQMLPTMRVGTMRRDAADALRYGCNGLLGQTWRHDNRYFGSIETLFDAAWAQPWNSYSGLQHPRPFTRIGGTVMRVQWLLQNRAALRDDVHANAVKLAAEVAKAAADAAAQAERERQKKRMEEAQPDDEKDTGLLEDDKAKTAPTPVKPVDVFPWDKLDWSKIQDGEVYWTQRMANHTQAYWLSYRFPVPNGTYRVTLLFMEIGQDEWHTTRRYRKAGDRVFDIIMQGKTIAPRFDIIANAGGPLTPLRKMFDNIPVTNGELVIDFRNGPACICGIRIEGQKAKVAVNCNGPAIGDYLADTDIYPVADAYRDWARAQFGPEVANEIGDILTRFDQCTGTTPVGSVAIGEYVSPGSFTRDRGDWNERQKAFIAIKALEALQPKVHGAGAQRRYECFLCYMRAMREQTHAFVMLSRFAVTRDKLTSTYKDDELRRKVKEQLLPIHLEAMGAVTALFDNLMAAVEEPGLVYQFINYEDLLNTAELFSVQLQDLLGEPLPVAALPVAPADFAQVRSWAPDWGKRDWWTRINVAHPGNDEYRGQPRAFVYSPRTLLSANENLELKVAILGVPPPAKAVLKWRPLGQGAYTDVPLIHVCRALYRVSANAKEIAGHDIEYYVEVTPEAGPTLRWPITAPTMPQTVTVLPW